VSARPNIDEAAPAAILPAEILAALQTSAMTTAQIAGYLGVLSTPKVNERIARELQQHGFEERAVRRLYEAFPRMFWLPRDLDEQSALERTFVIPELPSTMSGIEAKTIVVDEMPALPRGGDIDNAAAAIAKTDGLDWSEQCGFEEGEDDCGSGTCIAAHFEDHDPAMARDVYRRYARAAFSAAVAASPTPPTADDPADYEITDDGVMRPLDTWKRDNTGTYLRLMLEATNTVTEAEVAGWTDEQVQQADCWAFSTHLSASDNDDIQVPPRPSFIPYGDPYAGRNPMTGEPL
jgi:hypothetical protein